MKARGLNHRSTRRIPRFEILPDGRDHLRCNGRVLRTVCRPAFAYYRPDDTGGQERKAEYRRGEYGSRHIQENGTEARWGGPSQFGGGAPGLPGLSAAAPFAPLGQGPPAGQECAGTVLSKYRSYLTYRTYIEPPACAETAANTLVCLIHQANYLLDQQLRSLEQQFLKEGGFTENLYKARQQVRNSGKKP